MSHTRERAAAIGRQTQGILDAGHYTAPSGQRVDLAPLLRAAKAGTVSYPPEATLPTAWPGSHATAVAVANETTLAAARRLAAEGYAAAALNFASARRPGGGWLSGAVAQEETLGRASGLVPCIADDPMYARHAQLADPLYTSSAIYSPAVPVFRDDGGRLLDEPYCVAFITAPAPNAGVALERDRSRRPAIAAALRERVARVLAIAAAHNHDALVLGAWGCGVFRNDPHEVAALFAEALGGPFRGAFARVAFAVLDTSPERRFIGPFERAFQGKDTR